MSQTIPMVHVIHINRQREKKVFIVERARLQPFLILNNVPPHRWRLKQLMGKTWLLWKSKNRTFRFDPSNTGLN